MPVYAFGGREPQISGDAFVAPTATIIGAVELGSEASVWFGAVLRGDFDRITVGAGSCVQDNAVVHARPGETCTIGDWVTLGHGCVVHNVKLLGDYAVVGMNAVVSDWAEVGEWGVVAEGAVVRQRAAVPAARIAAGVPAHLLDREVDEEYRAAWRGFKQIYVDLCSRYAAGYGR